jgi:hypothetical protein
MKAFFSKPGTYRIVFAALLAAFNWPLLSIPGPGDRLSWLFAAWVLGIALLLLSALGAAGRVRQAPRGQDGPPEHHDA